jgi:uncharacterized SAM-binding protein YcdF (DUF218 family)
MATLAAVLRDLATKHVITERWVRFSWSTFDWLTDPWRVILPLLPLIVLPILLGSSRWKRWLSQPIVWLLLVYLIVISPPIAALMVRGLTFFVPADSGAPADAIVVLSRGAEEAGSRYELAVRLWQANRAPQIFVTAKGNVAKTHSLLNQAGAPGSVLSGTACAMTTQDEASSTAAILGPQGVRTIVLVTDPPHMLRSMLTFRGLGFAVIPHISPLPADLSSAKRSLLALREYPGLLSYFALGRFQQQSIDALEHPAPQLLQTVIDRGCNVQSAAE